MHFSRLPKIVATASSDKTIRTFDLRDLKSGSIVYAGASPILKLAWNRSENENLIAAIEADINHVTITDARMPIVPVMRLIKHTKPVNALAWAPKSSVHICTVSDDKKVFVWNSASSLGQTDII